MTIAELRIRSDAFIANLPATIERIINFNEDLEQLNKDQLKKSKLSNDSDITPDYSPGYAMWKSQFYPSSFGSGKVNLFLTGDLYKNMDIKVKGNQYQILSTVPYVPKLARKYGDMIFGIAPSNRQKAYTITNALIAKEYKERVL